YLLDQRAEGSAWAGQLLLGEIGRDRFHPCAGAGERAQKRDRERDRAGLYQDRPACRRVRRGHEVDRRADPGGAAWRGRGGRSLRGVPRRRRGGLVRGLQSYRQCRPVYGWSLASVEKRKRLNLAVGTLPAVGPPPFAGQFSP